MADSRPIGIFDSGVGGLSVMNEIRGLLFSENLIYLADSAHCPYGTRSREEIQGLASAIAAFLIDQGAKLIVVACNTASVASLAHLRASFAIPFVGMVPAVKPAAAASRARKVGVMATNATFQGDMFDELVQRFAADVVVVRQVCPGLVQAVEQGELDTPATRALLTSYVQPLVEAQVDTVVLGCTHYVFLRPLVEEMVGSEIAVIDSGLAVARQVARVLRDNGLENDAGNAGRALYYTTGDEGEVARVVARLTADSFPEVRSVTLESGEGEATRPHPNPLPEGEGGQ